MTDEQFFDKEVTDKVEELLIYAKHASKEERMILTGRLQQEAKKQKNIVQAVLIQLAEYIKQEPTSSANEVSEEK